jgi:hypothetical protein
VGEVKKPILCWLSHHFSQSNHMELGGAFGLKFRMQLLAYCGFGYDRSSEKVFGPMGI